MRKKKFLVGLLAVLLLAALSVSLVACKERVSSINMPDAPIADRANVKEGEMLVALLEGMGMKDNFVSMNFQSDIRTNTGSGWDDREFYLKGNFFNPTGNETVGEVELGMGIKSKAHPEQNVEIFLQNGRFYLKVGEGSTATTLYLEDIDFRWLIKNVAKLESLDNVVNKILSGVLPDMADQKVNDLIKLVAPMLFTADTKLTKITEIEKIPIPNKKDEFDYSIRNGHIALKLAPDELINTVVNAIGNTSIDGLLGGVGLVLRGPDGTPISIDDFIKTLAFPDIDIIIEADIKDGKLVMDNVDENGYYGLQMHVSDYQSEYFHMSTGAFYSNKELDILPANVKEYVPFGLLKLQFNTEVNLHTSELDAAKLVNFFAGSNLLPEGSLILSANADLKVKFDADIRLKEVLNSETREMDDKSLLMIEVYGGRQGDDTPLIGIYLKNRKVYINLDNAIRMAGGNIDIKPGNIVIDDVAVSKWLTHLIGMGTGYVDGLIDGIFQPQAKAGAQTFSAVADNGFDMSMKNQVVLSAGHDDNGKVYISKNIGTILDILKYTIGMEDYFKYENFEDHGNIRIEITNKFLAKLCEQFKINFEPLKNLDDFGKIELGININDNGLQDIYMDINIDKIEGVSPINANITLNNFHYGFGHTDALSKAIDEATAGRDYIGNIKDLIYNAVDDLDLEFYGKLEFGVGTYDMSNLFGFDLTQYGIPGIKVDVNEKFIMELKLQIQMQMDVCQVGYELEYKTNEKGEFELDADGNKIPVLDKNGNPVYKLDDKGNQIPVYDKIITRAHIGIINEKSNPILPNLNGIPSALNIYYLDYRYDKNKDEIDGLKVPYTDGTTGVLYADMSNFSLLQIKIPSFAVAIDLTDLIFGALGNLDLEFKIPDFIDKDKNSNNASAMSMFSATSARDSQTISMNDSSLINALYTPETAEQVDRIIKINVTSALINKILEIAGVNMGFTLPEINVEASIDYIQGITLSISGKEGTKDISLDLAINKFKVGAQIEIDITNLLKDFEEGSDDKYGEYINISSLSDGSTDGSMLKDLVTGIIYRAVNDVDIAFNFSATLGAGTYHINNILGINTNLPDIPIIASKDFELNFDINIQLQSVLVEKRYTIEDDKAGKIPEGYEIGDIIPSDLPGAGFEQIISRAFITLQNRKPNPITPKGNGVVKIMYFDSRYAGNSDLGLKDYNVVKTIKKNDKGEPILDLNGNQIVEYNETKTYGTLLLNLSTFNLLNFELPDVALDINLTNIVDDLIASLPIGGNQGGNNGDGESGNTGNTNSESKMQAMSQLFGMVADAEDGAEPEKLSFIQVAFTAELVKTLLSSFGVDLSGLGFDFPNFNGSINLDTDNISINITTWDKDDQETRTISAQIGMSKLHLGSNLNDSDIDVPADFDIARFGDPTALTLNSLLQSIIYRSLDDAELSFDLRFEITKGVYDVGKLFGMFGLDFESSMPGEEILPITVSQDFIMHLTLEIKLRWNPLYDFSEGQKPLGENGITRAEINLYNHESNIFFNFNSYVDENNPIPVLKAVYIDDRGPANNLLGGGYENFKKDVNGKKTNGTLFVDFTNFEFAKIKLPNLALDIDLTKEIKNIVGSLNLSDSSMLSSIDGNSARMASSVYGLVSDTANDGANALPNDNNYLQVLITMELLTNILKSQGIFFEVPDLFESLEGDFTISQINGIKLQAGLIDNEKGNEIYLSLGINYIHLGVQGQKDVNTGEYLGLPIDDLPLDYTIFGYEVISDLGAIIYRALDDTDISLKFDLEVPKGIYDVSPILDMAGIQMNTDTEKNPVYVEFTEDMLLKLALNIQIQMERVEKRYKVGDTIPTGYNVGDIIPREIDGKQQEGYGYETIISRAKIQIISYAKNFIFDGSDAGVPIISLYYFDVRDTRNNGTIGLEPFKYNATTKKVEKSYGTMFVNLSGVKIANIQIPNFSMDIDLNALIESLAKQLGGISISGNTAQQAMVASSYNLVRNMLVADSNADEGEDPGMGVTPEGNYIQLMVVSKFVQTLLGILGVDVTIELPDFDVNLYADADKGIAVVVYLNTTADVDGTPTPSNIRLELVLSHLALGVPTNIDISDFDIRSYSADFSELIKYLLQSGDISAKVNISSRASVINVQRLLNNILGASGFTMPIPINIDLNDFANELNLILQWKLDYENPLKSQLKLELRCDGNLVAGIYLLESKVDNTENTYSNVYVDLSGLGLPKFVLGKSRLIYKVIDLISSALDGVLDGIINLNTMSDLQTMAADSYGLSSGEFNSRLFTMALEDDGNIGDSTGSTGDEAIKDFTTNDYIKLILGAISIKDGVINANLTEKIVDTLLKQLGVNIAQEISVNATADLLSGKIKVDATFDEVTLNMALSLNNLGSNSYFVDMPTSFNGFPVLDISTSGLIFANSLFENLNPDMWIDLVSKNAAITQNYFKYTKIVMEKIDPAGKSLPYTKGGFAAGNSIMLTLLRMDGYAESNSSGTPALYIILDVENGSMRIRGTTNLLNVSDALDGLIWRFAGKNLDQLVDFSFPVDLKGMLANAFDGIIKEINPATGAANATTVGMNELTNLMGSLSIDSILDMNKGVTVKIYGVRNIKVSVAINHTKINELVPALFEALEGVPYADRYPFPNVYYNNSNDAAGFLDRLWKDLVLGTVVAKELGGKGTIDTLQTILGGTFNSIGDNVKDLVSRLMPLPQFEELELGVYIISGKLDNIALIGYGADNAAKYQRHKLELRIFNDMAGSIFFGEMDADHLNDATFQSPYVQFDAAVDSEDNFANKFISTAYKADKWHMYYVAQRDGDPSYLLKKAGTVEWLLQSYNANGFAIADSEYSNDISTILPNAASRKFSASDISAFKADGKYRTGYYVARGTATFDDGTIGIMDIRIHIEDNTDFINADGTVVQDIVVRAGNALPTAITLVNNKEGSQYYGQTAYIRNIVKDATNGRAEQEAIKFRYGDNCKRTKPGKDVIDNGDIYITVNGRDINKKVKITYDPATMYLNDTSDIHISIFDYKDFINNIYNASKVFVTTDDGRRIYQDVTNIEIVADNDSSKLFNFKMEDILDADGKVIGQKETREIESLANYGRWIADFDEDEEFSATLRIHLNNSFNDQTLERKIIVDRRHVAYVRFDSRDQINMDTIETKQELPRSVRVYYTDGTYEVRSISLDNWYVDGVNFGTAGTYTASFRFNQDYDLSGNFNLNLVQNIKIKITEGVIAYAKVGPDNGERWCDISYEDYANGNFGNLDLRLITSNGKAVDYIDSFTYIEKWYRPAGKYIIDGNEVNLAEDTIYNTDADRGRYTKLSDAYKATYEIVTQKELNYDVIAGGAIGANGGIVKVTVKLFNMTAGDYNSKPVNGNTTDVYLYFKVAPSPAQVRG